MGGIGLMISQGVAVGIPDPVERRTEPRFPLSCPVWWRQNGDVSVCHGWMVDLSAHGAALLMPKHIRPALGDSISLSLVGPPKSLDPKVSRLLLDRATVYRIDMVAPSLDRVALRFDTSALGQDESSTWRGLAGMFEGTPASAAYASP